MSAWAQRIAPFSKRQRALLACLVDGLTPAEAAAALGVHERTEKRDMRRIREVFGARNRQHAAAIAGALSTGEPQERTEALASENVTRAAA